MITADSSTDYGNVNGGGVVSVLKSGTNNFHGSAYGYVQDYRFNANSYGNGQSTPATPDQSLFFRAVRRHNRRADLHNKLFFFVDYLGSRWHMGGRAKPA